MGDVSNGGGQGTGFHNIDALPLGTILQVKQDRGYNKLGSRRGKKLNVRKLMEKGFK